MNAMHRRSPGLKRFFAACAVLVGFLAAPASAVTFQNVVSLGDSLLDARSNPGRGPVLSEHVAARLGVPHTRLAIAGSTTSSLIAGGQHTTAAAMFGPGDLAVLFIGGNDILGAQVAVATGNYAVLNSMEANVDTILSTLRGAGMDVVVLSLPDLATVPQILLTWSSGVLPNFTTVSDMWRTRIDNLAATHGAVSVDTFAFSQQLQSSPGDFELFGNLPTLGPAFGDIVGCPMCVFFDLIHPSAVAQGFISNRTLAAINTVFDPGGAMPLPMLSLEELFSLTGAPGRVFGQKIVSTSKTQFCWQFPQAFLQLRGDLGQVADYTTNQINTSGGAQLSCFDDLSTIPAGFGAYYVVKHDFPGSSWQTSPGDESLRDTLFP